jgi:hypothetical protein
MKEQAHYSMVLARLHELGDSTAAAEIQGRPRAERLSRPLNFAAYGPGPAAAARSQPDTAGQAATRSAPGRYRARPLVRGCFRWWWQVLGSNQRSQSCPSAIIDPAYIPCL